MTAEFLRRPQVESPAKQEDEEDKVRAVVERAPVTPVDVLDRGAGSEVVFRVRPTPYPNSSS